MNKAYLFLLRFVLAISAMWAPSAIVSPHSQDNNCGAAVNGLQICLAPSGSNLVLAFRNVGDRDLTLDLGIMLANGKIQLPDRVAMKSRMGKAKHGFSSSGSKTTSAAELTITCCRFGPDQVTPCN